MASRVTARRRARGSAGCNRKRLGIFVSRGLVVRDENKGGLGRAGEPAGGRVRRLVMCFEFPTMLILSTIDVWRGERSERRSTTKAAATGQARHKTYNTSILNDNPTQRTVSIVRYVKRSRTLSKPVQVHDDAGLRTVYGLPETVKYVCTGLRFSDSVVCENVRVIQTVYALSYGMLSKWHGGAGA